MIIIHSIPQIYCIFLFLNAACLFGSLMSQLNDIIQAATRESRALEEHMDGYISFMTEYG